MLFKRDKKRQKSLCFKGALFIIKRAFVKFKKQDNKENKSYS
jgi:hypothetical protein